jgi:hypothetical protein
LILGLGGSLMLSADSVFRLVRRRSIANHRRVTKPTFRPIQSSTLILVAQLI